jgi:hypothetical protein
MKNIGESTLAIIGGILIIIIAFTSMSIGYGLLFMYTYRWFILPHGIIINLDFISWMAVAFVLSFMGHSSTSKSMFDVIAKEKANTNPDLKKQMAKNELSSLKTAIVKPWLALLLIDMLYIIAN